MVKQTVFLLHLNCFRWFFDSCRDIISLFRCCCIKSAFKQDFHIVSFVFCYFPTICFFLFVANSRNLRFNLKIMFDKGILFWLKFTRFVWLCLCNTIDISTRENRFLYFEYIVIVCKNRLNPTMLINFSLFRFDYNASENNRKKTHHKETNK